MIDTRILVGLLAVLITISTIIYVGINEPDRQAEFKQAFAGRNVETGAQIYGEFCSPCHGIQGQGIPGVAPALNDSYYFHERLDELGYQGSLQSYISLTVAGGRPVQSGDGPWPQNMPTWSVDYGGPLRNDQVDAVTDFVLHWGDFVPEPGEPGVTPTPLACGTSEECGELLFQNLGCIGCHIINGEGGGVGPELTNIYAEQGPEYIVQSILNPNVIIAEGYQANIMPQNFGDRLSQEELDNIVSYLASVSQ